MRKKVLLLVLVVVFVLSMSTVAFAYGSSDSYSISTWGSGYDGQVQRGATYYNHGYDDNTYAAYDGWKGTSYTSRIYCGTNKAGSVMNMSNGASKTCEIQPPYYDNTNLALVFRLKVQSSNTSYELGTVGRFGAKY